MQELHLEKNLHQGFYIFLFLLIVLLYKKGFLKFAMMLKRILFTEKCPKTESTKKILHSIRETKNLSTDVDSSTHTKKTLPVRQSLPKKLTFFAQRFFTLYGQKFSNPRPLLTIFAPRILNIKIFWTLNFRKWGKRPLNRRRKNPA